MQGRSSHLAYLSLEPGHQKEQSLLTTLSRQAFADLLPSEDKSASAEDPNLAEEEVPFHCQDPLEDPP